MIVLLAPCKKSGEFVGWIAARNARQGGGIFSPREITIFPGNMQQWQVNQREHLFTSQWRERELDRLLCMQTQAAQGKHLFIPSWMRSSPRRRPRSLRGVELRTHARRSETNTKALFIGELLHALPCCKANNCEHCMCPALDVNKRITSRVTFPGHDTIK